MNNIYDDLSHDLNIALEEVLHDVKKTKSLKQRSINIDDIDVHQIRDKYHMTQAEFSQTFGFSIRTLQHWEQKTRKPHGAARILLKVIDYDPKLVERALHI